MALQFALNLEEGAERTPLNGDEETETYLNELPPGTPRRGGARHPGVESLFDYGTRAGFWRILRLFREHGLPLTAFVCGRSLELVPEAGRALAADGHELAGHGYRWIDHSAVSAAVEAEQIAKTVDLIARIAGRRPVGWYSGRSSANTRGLLIAAGGFLYDSDSYSDDLPYWLSFSSGPHLVVPYALDTNDARYYLAPGFASGRDFFAYLRDALAYLRREAECGAKKMMSVGLHGRITGRPARAAALARFLEHLRRCPDVWVCRREEIARHWIAAHPPARQTDV